jgi:hypothetical protein
VVAQKPVSGSKVWHALLFWKSVTADDRVRHRHPPRLSDQLATLERRYAGTALSSTASTGSGSGPGTAGVLAHNLIKIATLGA